MLSRSESSARMKLDTSSNNCGGGHLPSNKDLFQCLLCCGSFTDPKCLDCQHIFCEACLHVYYRTYHNIQYDQLGVLVPCPVCREVTQVPPNGLQDLGIKLSDEETAQKLRRKVSVVTDGQLQKCDLCILKTRVEEPEFYCSKCTMNFCRECKTAHNQHVVFKEHTTIHISNKETLSVHCDRHNRLPCHYFCNDCNIAICVACVMIDHVEHNTAKIRDTLIQRRDDLKLQLNSLGPKLERTEAKVKKLLQICTIFATKTLEIGSQGMHRSVSQGHFDDRHHPARKLSTLDHQRKQSTVTRPCTNNLEVSYITSQIDNIKKLFDLTTKILEMSQSKKLMSLYDDIMNRLKTVIDDEMQKLQTTIDKLLVKEIGMNNGMTLQLSSTSFGSSGSQQEKLNSTSVSSESSSIEEFVFDVQEPSFMLVKPKLQWEVKNDPGELCNPCDVTFLPDGSLVVAEYDIMNDKNNKLRVFDTEGRTIRIIGQGKVRPLGVTATPEGNIAVIDCRDKRVKIFNTSGQLVSEWGKGMFGWPYGIAINSKGHYIISDAFNDSISIHQADGRKIKQIGSSGSGSSQFKNPYHVAVDEQDNIYVSDCGNHCVKVFDSNGKFVRIIRDTVMSSISNFIVDDRKKKRRKLRSPRGLCIDMKGNMLLADDHSRVCIFENDGKYLKNILTEEDSVKFAESLAVGPKGLLAVTEWNPSNVYAVKVFVQFE